MTPILPKQTKGQKKPSHFENRVFRDIYFFVKGRHFDKKKIIVLHNFFFTDHASLKSYDKKFMNAQIWKNIFFINWLF